MEYIDYFQLIFLIFFYILFIGRTIILSIKGIQVFVLGEGKRGIDRFLEIGFIVLLFFWTIVVVLKIFHIPMGFLPALLTDELFPYHGMNIAGIIINSVGIIIFIAALLSFGTSWRIGIDKSKPDRLITTGIFSFTRNPIFLFMDLYFIGTWCIYSNLFFLFCSIVTILGIHYQIRKEEIFLLSHYDEEYRIYMKKVRRYI